MNLNFPKGVYSDVRIEHVFNTNIRYVLKRLEECKTNEYSAAFLRVFDGDRWYFCSTTNLDNIQAELDNLASLAKKNDDILQNPTVLKMSKNVANIKKFEKTSLREIPLNQKQKLLETAMSEVENEKMLTFWAVVYADSNVTKQFSNCLGADLTFDFQKCGFVVHGNMANGDQNTNLAFQRAGTVFDDLTGFHDGLKAEIDTTKDFLLNSVAVEAGTYTVVLSQEVTGVFTHECFGHKSEADFMLGDENAKKEWTIGKKIAVENLNILDSGEICSSGYVPFDDEGNKAGKNYLIKNGVLAGRLHSAQTAAYLDEKPTGNARALDYEFEPIVRMTHTYIENGDMTFEQLISDIENGLYIKSCKHGSGNTTFTIAPRIAYYIKNGKIDKPVRISVVTGNVFQALANIEGIANDLKHIDSALGGCGKMAQGPLPVGMGGPHIRVKGMTAQ